MMMSDVLNGLFARHFGAEPLAVAPLPSSGSHRRYYRLEGTGGTAIGVVGTDADENRAFLTEARHFRSKGIRVPEVYAVSPDGMAYLQEDLGCESLYDPRFNEGNLRDCSLVSIWTDPDAFAPNSV